MNDTKKEKLKEILDMISSPTDKEEGITIARLNKLSRFLESFSAEVKSANEELKNQTSLNAQEIKMLKKSIKPADYTQLVELLDKIHTGISNIKLQERIDRDYSPAYKMMIEKLSNVDQKMGGWKYPQYAYTGLRNKSFSPINPAEDGIGLSTYDYVSLAQTSLVDTYTFKTGGASGTLVATVAITFTDSTKTTISNVVKT